MKRRIDPLYLIAAVVAVVALIVIVAAAGAPVTSSGRSASASDGGPGGAGTVRRYLEAMGARTSTVEGAIFDPSGADVLLVLAPSETISEGDVARLVAFIKRGGTVVLAADTGIAERALLTAYGMRVAGIAAPGAHDLSGIAFADPRARTVTFDRGITLAGTENALILATDGAVPIAVATRDNAGVLIVVGSAWPFLGAGLGEPDNARFVLSLVRPALAGGSVAFDEYHHGVHPTSDITVLLERTWPGRALVFATVMVFLYLALSGRRLGPPLPVEVRPARSSLEYVRGFAGLVRRSGRGEIARRRLRTDLRGGLARRLGLDPATDFERVLAVLGAADRTSAARARAVDESLGRRLRDADLLRTVADIDELLAVRS